MSDPSTEEAGFEYPLRFPLEDMLKDLRVACSNCSRVSPLTPRQIEEQGLPFGWQLRLIHSRIAEGDAVRWDLFCHACAGEASPRPPDSIRISSRPDSESRAQHDLRRSSKGDEERRGLAG